MAPLSRPFLTPFAFETILRLAEFLVCSQDSNSHGFDLHLPTLQPVRFQLEPDSACPLCSTPIEDSATAATITLASRLKMSPKQYRLKKVCEVHVPHERYLNSTCGMLGRDFKIKRDHGFIAQASGNFRSSYSSNRQTAWYGRHSSYRNSLTSGLLEAFERHAGLRIRAKRCVVFDSYKNLKNEALDPRACGVYEPAFIQTKTGLLPFTEDMQIHWVWGHSLSEHRAILVPLQLVYYRNRSREEPLFVLSNSNGCATGTCLEEAILFGLLELIERDAFLIHWRARLSPPQIDPDSVSDLESRFLIERLRRADLDIYLFDTRLDIPVPSIAAALLRRDLEPGTLTLAMACSLHPEHAMKSALAEAAGRQFGFHRRTRAKAADWAALKDFSGVRTMEDHALLYGLPEAFRHAEFLFKGNIQRSMSETYKSWLGSGRDSYDLLEDVDHCMKLLALAGLNQVVVVNQSTPEENRLGLHTVRVIVPGLMPLDFGHGSCRSASLSRLHSVPIRLGLLAGKISADQMNWAPHPFS
jgi:ribosomal protein S12 methylthiotransferase accessory factor